MKRFAAVASLVAALGGLIAGAAAADPSNDHASCEGILVSAATYPGEIADVGRALHEQFKQLGLPPGFLDVGAAQLKEGNFDACVAALPA
jgi:hypothetical protein